jgi:hypothetical protein
MAEKLVDSVKECSRGQVTLENNYRLTLLILDVVFVKIERKAGIGSLAHRMIPKSIEPKRLPTSHAASIHST